MTRPRHARWALAALAVTALALGGCGRKGGLDLPPSVPQNAAGDPIQGPGGEPLRDPIAGPLAEPADGLNAPPVAAPGRKRRFIADPLID